MLKNPIFATYRAADCLFICALLLASLFFYSSLLDGSGSFVFRDMFTILLPFEHIVKSLIGSGQLPLWNPYAVLGKPLAAEPLAGIFYLPNLVFFRFPQPLSQNFSIILHHFAAGLGCYLLCRRLGSNAGGALCGAVFFSFGGMLVSLDNMINALQSATWLPWTIWSASVFLESKRKPYFGLLAFFIMLTLIGGMPEVVLMEFALLFFLCFYGNKKPADAFKDFNAALAAVLCGFLLSAVFFFPFLEYLLQSSRSEGLDPKNALKFSVDPRNLAGFILGRRLIASDGSFQLRDSIAGGYYTEVPWALSYYLGLAVPLALLAAVKAGRRGSLFGFAALVFFLLISLGRFLPGTYEVFQGLPVLASVRYPEKWLIAVHLVLSVAAAFGVTSLFKGLFLNTLPILIALVSFLDLMRVNAAMIPHLEWRPLMVPPAATGLMKSSDKPLRIYSNSSGLPRSPDIQTETRLSIAILQDQVSAFFGIANLNSPASINLSAHEKLMPIIGRSKNNTAKILGSLGVRYVLSKTSLAGYPGFVSTGSTDPFVYSIQDAAPRISLAKKAYAVGSQDEALRHLQTSENPVSEVAVEAAGVPEISAEGEIEIVKYSANDMEIRVGAKNPVLLVIRDSFYPGWRAAIDEKPAEILRANGVLRGIIVPAGLHTVNVYYRPDSLIWGAGVSLVTLLSILVYLAVPVGKPGGYMQPMSLREGAVD